MCRTAARVLAVCLLAGACACSSRAGSNNGSDDAALQAQAEARPWATALPAGGLSFNLTNFTGSTLRAVYISPSDSERWEENVLGGEALNDGNNVTIRFSPEQSAVLWDVRVESADEHCAEWKGLDFRGVSRITLLLNLVGQPTVVAEIE